MTTLYLSYSKRINLTHIHKALNFSKVVGKTFKVAIKIFFFRANVINHFQKLERNFSYYFRSRIFFFFCSAKDNIELHKNIVFGTPNTFK